MSERGSCGSYFEVYIFILYSICILSTLFQFVKAVQLLCLALVGFVLRRLDMHHLCFGFFWDGEPSRTIKAQHHVCTDMGPTSKPVCADVYLSHRPQLACPALYSTNLWLLFCPPDSPAELCTCPCSPEGSSALQTISGCTTLHPDNGYLLTARKCQSHGSLKAMLKRASSVSICSPIWFSSRDFHQRKKLSLPFTNH